MSEPNTAAEATGAATPDATEAVETETLSLGADGPEPSEADAEEGATEEGAESTETEPTVPDAKEPPVAAEAEKPAPTKIDLAAEREARKGIAEKLDAERKARENEIAAKAAQESAEKYSRVERLAKEDPEALLDEFGLSLDDLIERAIAKAKGEDVAAPSDGGETPREKAMRIELEKLRADADKIVKETSAQAQQRAYSAAIADTTEIIRGEGDRFAALEAAGVGPDDVYREFGKYVSKYNIELKDGATAKNYLLAIADELNDAEVQRAERVAAKISGRKPPSNATSEANTGKSTPPSKKLSARNAMDDDDDDLPLDPVLRARALRSMPLA